MELRWIIWGQNTKNFKPWKIKYQNENKHNRKCHIKPELVQNLRNFLYEIFFYRILIKLVAKSIFEKQKFPDFFRSGTGVGNKSQNPGNFRDRDWHLELIFKIWDLRFILEIWDLGFLRSSQKIPGILENSWRRNHFFPDFWLFTVENLWLGFLLEIWNRDLGFIYKT